MNTEPLTREERRSLFLWTNPMGWDYFNLSHAIEAIPRYEATVQAAEERAERLRAALEEISVPPDANSSRGEDYGCLDLHEARKIAFDALDADDAARGDQ